MSKDAWIQQVINNRPALKSLINDWHPSKRGEYVGDITITAKNAEAACRVIRRQIKEEFKGDVILKFDEAIDAKEWKTIYRILSDTWFGVPESLDCWSIRGFKEAVDLLDDTPGA